MTHSAHLREWLGRIAALALLIVLSLYGAAVAGGAEPTRLASALEPWIVAQRVCSRRIGNYATNDRALAVRNQLAAQGYRAWVETEGSLYGGTRSYAVFVATPC